MLTFPSFNDSVPLLNQFILELVDDYNAGKIRSWDMLDKKVREFYTQEIMDTIESIAPGWKKMASYSGGITLTHVNCVFLGMSMLAEYQALSSEQQQIAKWIILFHDIDKFHIRGKKDTMHAFNSAVITANLLAGIGFPVTQTYSQDIAKWSSYTRNAFIATDVKESPKPDNQKLPEILAGIDSLFGKDSPAALITKTVLLHISLDADKNYPTPAPLTEDEIRLFISPGMFPLLKVMMLSDNEGWSLFNPPVSAQQKHDVLIAFERVQEIIT